MQITNLIDLPALLAESSIAFIDTDGRELTYRDQRDRASSWAGLLHSCDVHAGERVGIMTNNCAESIAVMFGATTLGAIAVPMNVRATAAELSHLLIDSGVKVLVTEERYVDLIEQARTEDCTVLVIGADLDERLATGKTIDDSIDVDDDGEAFLLYTSGTTSKPKGVRLTHGALSRYVIDANDPADGDDHGRMLLAAPLSHVAGLTSMLHSLWSGRITVLLPQFEAEAWISAVEAHQITHAFLVPTMLARVLAARTFDRARLESLRELTYGAAPMPPPLLERAIEALGHSVAFSGAYGQTETTSTVAVLGPDDHRLTGSAHEVALKRQRLRSVGQVLDEVEVRITDPDGQPVGVGHVGEVQLRTYRVMTGYWGDDEKTRITVDDEGWIHTGDLGHLDDEGYLYLAGRKGDLIIRGGENVSPDEVEGVLLAHPDVVDVGVCGQSDNEWGELVVATIVLADGSDVSDVERHAKEHLAPFKRPTIYRVVDDLPRTATGKLLRQRLLDAALLADAEGSS